MRIKGKEGQDNILCGWMLIRDTTSDYNLSLGVFQHKNSEINCSKDKSITYPGYIVCICNNNTDKNIFAKE